MSLQMLSLGVAALMVIGLVVGIGVFSLLSGGLHFLFAKPSYQILKSKKGKNGFSFSFSWNNTREPAGYTSVRLRMFNPFGTPTQIDIKRSFDSKNSDFALDLDLGEEYTEMLEAKGFDDALVELEFYAAKDGLTQSFKMKGHQFRKKLESAVQTSEQFNAENAPQSSKPLFHTVQKSFVAGPLPSSSKTLKIASNPEFAEELSGGGAEAKGETVENFAMSKVWIEDGCIVCDACETIAPDVFEVKDGGCIVRPGAPLENGLMIQEAAEACPVEIIKFNPAS